MFKLRAIWDSLRTSLWFVPSIMVATSVLLALGLIEFNTHFEGMKLEQTWPRVFGAGAEGARGMLVAIASSMITVAGVAFSVTIVSLALASSQYSPRVMRNFMRDRANQMVLGAFVSIFVYCLVVLRTIRGGDHPYVPSIAILFAVVLAFFGIGCLIFFIHHIASSIQATSIVQAVANETYGAIDRLFPSQLGIAPDEDCDEDNPSDDSDPCLDPDDHSWIAVPARRTGYIQGLDADALLSFAGKQKCIVRMQRGIGDFVVEGETIAALSRDEPPDHESEGNGQPQAEGSKSKGSADPLEQRGANGDGKGDRQIEAEEDRRADDETIDALNSVYSIGAQRTTVQDAAFGISQIVDVALKALSPGINDTHTAIICIDHLMALMARLAVRRMEPKCRAEDGALRVIARGPTFAGLLGEAFDQIRRNADGNVSVQLALLNAIEVIAAQTQDVHRLEALRRQIAYVDDLAVRTVGAEHDLQRIEAAVGRVFKRLNRQIRERVQAKTRPAKECAK